MMQFTPKGEQARWRMIYDRLCQMQVDDELTYEELGILLSLQPGTERHLIQMAMRRAAEELLEVNCRAVECMRNKGYRVVEPAEHLRLARGHNRKAGKALDRSYTTATKVDVTGLDQLIRDALQSHALMVAGQLQLNRRLERESRKMKAALETVATKQGLSDERLARLEERLAKLEFPSSD